MSILIKGMEMPEMRKAYAGLIIYWDGEVFPFIPPQGYELGESIATAVPIPPHGRLIDADALEKEHMKRAYENFRSYQFHVSATAWINEAPTIIPAEPAEEASDGE